MAGQVVIGMVIVTPWPTKECVGLFMADSRGMSLTRWLIVELVLFPDTRKEIDWGGMNGRERAILCK